MKVQCNIVNVVALNVSPEVDQVVRWSRPLLDPPNVNDMNPTLASAVIELDTKVRNDLLKAPISTFTFKNLLRHYAKKVSRYEIEMPTQRS